MLRGPQARSEANPMQPMTSERLAAIERHAKESVGGYRLLELVAEVKRLRGEIKRAHVVVDMSLMQETECSGEDCDRTVLRHPRTVGPVYCNPCCNPGRAETNG